MSIETLLEETKGFFRESSVSEKQIEAVLGSIIEGTEIPKKQVQRFMIRRLVVDGEVECDLQFESGVNVIKADNFKGKTSVLKIIKLAIMGRDKLDDKLRDKVKEIFLEFQMDEKIYTSYMCRYRKRGSKPAWAIYESVLDEVIPGESDPLISKKKKIIEFFMTQFGLPKITQKKAQRGRLESGEKLVGFGDYFRAFYQDQKRGYNEIMSPNHSTKVSVMSVMMGQHEAEFQNKCDKAIDDKGKEIEILEKKIQDLEKRMKLRAKRFGFTKDFDTQLKEREVILSKKKRNLKGLYRQKDTYLESNISSLLEDIDYLEKNIDESESQRCNFQLIISDLKGNKSQLMRDIRWMEEEMASTAIFKSYFVRTCPLCRNEISMEKIRLEKETQRCALCGSEIELDEERISIMGNEISERKKNVNELRNRIKEYEKSLKILLENIKRKREKRIQLYKDKEKIKKHLDRDFLPKIVDLTREITRIETELSELHYSKQEILENRERITLKESELKIMKQFDKLLKENILGNDTSEKQIKKHMVKYMKEFLEMAMGSGFETVELYDMEPKIDDMKFEVMPEGEKVRASMAIYYGLLMMGLKHNGKLPCFLIIDAPRQQEMQEVNFHKIVRTYRNLDEQHGEEVQVIISSADPAVIDATSNPSKRIEFEEGEMILRDKKLENPNSATKNDLGGILAFQTNLEDFQ